MKKVFIDQLIKATRKNRDICLIVNDLGYGMLEPFTKEFPRNIFNAGISEQSMIGYAAGLSATGKHVFVYSIANFNTFRCAEQIRNDVDYHNLPVTIVSSGAGVGYGNLGYSHHAIQDYSLMRCFPNMLIASPGDIMELKSCMNFLIKNPQPSYLRMDKDDHANIAIKKEKILPGKIIKIISGNKKKIILVTGSVQNIAKKLIKNKYKGYSLYSMPIWGMKIKKKVKSIIKKFNEVVTLEDHFCDGGFGSWIQEIVNNSNIKTKIKSQFIKDDVIYKVGSKDYLLRLYGPK